MKRFGFIVLTLFLLVPGFLYPEERLMDFSEDIFVHVDRTADVFLNVEFVSEGRNIRHGLYFDFVEKWRDEYGKRRSYSIKVEGVRRDGYVEDYHVTYMRGGFRLYVGSSERLLAPGKHFYNIHLKVYGMVQSYEDFDQLYWTVVGTRWKFPIERAEAKIHMPGGGMRYIRQYTGYVGRYGTTGRRPVVEVDRKKGILTFRVEEVIPPGNGFTIAVSWRKGFFVRETLFTRYGYILDEHRNSLLLLLLLFVYYITAWLMVGRDPERGTIVPLYYPPKGISPGGARFILKMGYDRKVMVANIVDLAVKGYVVIKDDDGDITLERTSKAIEKGELTRDEEKLLKTLFTASGVLYISRTSAPVLREAERKLKKSLLTMYEGRYFVANLPFFLAGLGLSILVLGVAAFEYNTYVFLLFLSVWILIWSMGVTALLRTTFAYFRIFLESRRFKDFFGFLAMLLFSLPFVAGEFVGFFFMWKVSDIYFPVLTVVVVVLGVVFYHLLKAPTRLGRRVMDEIEGFKLYLQVAEKERLQVLAEKIGYEKLYESYLPYAIAFDLEKKWGERFDIIFSEMGRGSYTPSWYSGGIFVPSMLGVAVTGAVLSSLSSATTSSSAAGGGGSVGGGGGGGGGGGW